MLMTETTRLHVRVEGRSEELELEALGLTAGVADAELLAALARRYRLPAEAMSEYIVAREDRAIIVRPVAFYG